MAWLGAGSRRDPGADLELVLGCLMLNASALVLWNALSGPEQMFAQWAPQAAVGGVFVFLVQGLRTLRQAHPHWSRTMWPSGAWTLAAVAIALLAPAAHAQTEETPADTGAQDAATYQVVAVVPVRTDPPAEAVPAGPEPPT